MGEQGAQCHRQRIVLRVAPEVVGNEHGAGHVLLRNSFRQFEVVEILADTYVVLDVLRGDSFRSFGQEGKQLGKFVGDAGDVRARWSVSIPSALGSIVHPFDWTKSPSQAVIS